MKVLILIIVFFSSMVVKAQLSPFFSASNNKYGYKNSEGKEVVTPKYDLAYGFTEGMAAVRLNGKYGYINETGKEIVAPKYDFTWKFIGGYAAVKLAGKTGFIDLSGKEVIAPIYEEANNYHGACCYKGMAHVKKNGKWRIIEIKK